MSFVLNLESFDELSKVGDGSSFSRVRTYEEGFDDGESTTVERFSTEQFQLRASVVDSLSDCAFGYHEAQIHLLHGMQSYIDALLNLVLPEIILHGFRAQLRDILVKALRDDVGRPLTVMLPENQIEAFSKVVADLNLLDVNLIINEQLTEHAAFISGPTGETAIDFDEILSAIKDHTSILNAPSEQVS